MNRYESTAEPSVVILRTALAAAVAVVACGVLIPVSGHATGTVTAWNYNGGKLNGFSPKGLSDVVKVATNSIAGGFALKKDGSVYQFSTYKGYEGPTLKAKGPYVDLVCNPGICWVKTAAGVWSELSTTNITPKLPSNLNTSVTLAGGYSYGLAVQAGGTVTPWGKDWNGGKGLAKVKALKGVKSAVASTFVAAFLRSNGTVEVISLIDSKKLNNVAACNQDGTMLNIPAGVVATQIALGDCLGAALHADGTVTVWGYWRKQVPTIKLPSGLKKIRKIAIGWTLTLLQVDGTVRKYTMGTDNKLVGGKTNQDPANLLQLKNVFDIAQSSSATLLAHSSNCGGISWRGCCEKNIVKHCNDSGQLVAKACANNTCGWAAKGGMFSDGAYTCNTTGKPTPVGAPYKPCTCEPSCGTRKCGDDGCGGSCGTCEKNTKCDASGACKCAINCDDGNVCTVDSCNAKGCLHTANSVACSAGKCSTGDKCVAKSCVAGTAISCDDKSKCTNDSCNIAKGCQHAAVVCNDTNPCTTDSCNKATGCVFAHNANKCSDGSKCTTTDVCGGGKCKAGPALKCNDGNSCTDDSCSPATGCVFKHNSAACSDNNACTQKDVCSGGKCKAGAPPVCNDGNPCTDDSCNVKSGCTTKATSKACTDNNACTKGDICSAGKCKPGAVIKCDDGNLCTSDACHAQKGCTYTPNTLVCDDGNVCSTGDKCSAGKCKGSGGLICDDGNPCTDDPCDGKGGCAKKPRANGVKCDDGNACTSTGTCTAGKCGGFTTINCNDGRPCTIDSCVKTTGCKHIYSTAPCDDGNPCTAGDKCSGGLCKAGVGCHSNAVCTLSGGVGKCVCKHGYVGDGKSCSACKINCAGRECGSNGCGGSCGACKTGTLCSTQQKCVCAPKCVGRTCGPDGCGGQCGKCPTGQACNNHTGKCAAVCLPKCDGKTCGADGCGGTCGACGPGEFCFEEKGTCRSKLCPSVPPAGCCIGNTALTCGPSGAASDNCNTTWKWCDWDAKKKAYACVDKLTGGDPSGDNPRSCTDTVCKPDCKGKLCGSDGCGGTCGTCGTGKLCNFEAGACYTDPCHGFAAHGCCKQGSAVTCHPQTRTPQFASCGTGVAACGWDGKRYACSGNAKVDPSGKAPIACPASLCVPDCKGRNCGTDGCGGSCGACRIDQDCIKGVCCTPDCKGKNCGSDGCGGTCGTCGKGLICKAGLGLCVGADQCEGAPYGVGCCAGQTFKICNKPFTLAEQVCSNGKGHCGWDPKFARYGCGTLGTQSPYGHPKLCKGALACVPECANKNCGPDGCGGICPNLCAKGQACTNNGGCVDGCGEVPVDGCCAGGKLYYCGQKGLIGSWGIRSIDCKGKGMGCGFSSQGASYACVPGMGSADPSGKKKMKCPASLSKCTPDCKGKTCGDDGCGGSCGTCKGFEKCEAWSGTCYVPPPNCNGAPWEGSCSGSKLTFCSASKHLVSKECGSVIESHNGTTVNLCKWLPQTGANGCVGFVDEGKHGYPTCNPPWKNQCGIAASYRACQCDLNCEVRGDCCADFVGVCGEKLGVSRCGDSTCNKARGEGCATCPADCKSQCQSAGSDLVPPWPAPFKATLAMADKPPQRAEMVITPLDLVLPGVPPVPQDGLLKYLPSRFSQSGAPQTHVVFGDLGAGGLVAAKGVQGASLGLLKGGTNASGGVVRIALQRPLPRKMELKKGLMGGMSLAMWIKIPSQAPNTVLPLASTFGKASDVSEVCAWSRPADAKATVTCPKGQKIVGLYGYYGAVNKQQLVKWNAYTVSLYAGQGYCALMASQGPTHACEFEAIQPWLEKRCLGKTKCHIDAYKAAKDPCVAAADPNIKSTLMVRALCAPTQPVATAVLAVDDVAGGRKLRFEVPGLPPLVATSNLQSGSWRHVALVHRPFLGAANAGVTTLYVDGKPEASSETLVPPPLSHLWLGAATLATLPKGAPNVIGPSAGGPNAGDQALAMVGDLDEAYLYDRALSDREVRALRDKPALNLARVWPGLDPRGAIEVKGWTSAKAAKTTVVTADKLQGPGATTKGQGNERLKANWLGLRVAPGGKLRLPMPVGSLAKANAYSFGAWLKVPSLTAGKALLTLEQSGAPSLTIASDAACGGRGLVATAPGGVTTSTPACDHGLVAGRWAFVSVAQDSGGLDLRVDGYLVGSSKATAVLLPGAATMASLTAAGELELGWAALFDAKLGLDALQRWRTPGPAVWLDGAAYTKGSTVRLRDYADFHNGTTAADGKRLPVAWNKAGAPAALKMAPGPLVLTQKTGGANVAAVTVPASGRFAPTTAGTDRPTTWSAHLVFGLPTGGIQANVPLIESRAAAKTRRFGARLLCDRVGSGSGVKAQCRVQMVSAAAAWTTEKWLLTWPKNKAGAAVSVDVDVAVTWGDNTPRVAIGTRAPSGSYGGPSSRNRPIDARTLKVSAAKQSWPVDTAVWPASMSMLATVAPFTPATAQLWEMRLYPRALQPSELIALVRRSCDDAPCVNRVCTLTNAAALPGCGPCRKSHFEAGDQMGDLCLPRRAFYATCSAHEQCASNYCAEGRCQAKTKTAECASACAGRHRTCVSHQAKLLGKNTMIFGCSTGCIAYYKQPAFEPTIGPCIWNPDTADAQPCTVDVQCISGKCVANNTAKYSGGVVGGKVCAYGSKTACKKLHRAALAIQNVPLTGKPAFTCAGCSKQLYLGKPLWREGYSLMTKAACAKGSSAATWTTKHYQTKWEPCFHNGEVSLKCLGILLLGKTGKLVSKDIAKLRKLGIGPDLLRWVMTGKRAWSWGGKFCYCGKCPTYTISPQYSVYHNPTYNRPVCLGQQFPNGTTCPPPGVKVSEGQAHQFCESGFCARDTHQCEDGVARVEDTRSADRQDARSSKKPSSYGPITLTQTNRATLEVRKIKEPTASKAAPKRAYTLKASNTQAMSVFGSASFDVVSMGLSLRGQMDAKKAQSVPHMFLFGIEQPKVKSLTPPSACSGAHWVNGQYQNKGKCGVAWNKATKTLTVPKLRFCPAIFKGCEASKSLPKGWKTGPACISRTTFVGPVPIFVEADARIEMCINMGLAIDSMTFEPGFSAGPELDIGVEVKGGVGVDEFITVFAGVKGQLSLLNLQFPVTWVLKVQQLFGPNKTMVEGLFRVIVERSLAVEMTLLKLSLSLFAEVGFGPFTAETEYPIYEWGGIKIGATLGSQLQHVIKLDLNNPLANQ